MKYTWPKLVEDWKACEQQTKRRCERTKRTCKVIEDFNKHLFVRQGTILKKIDKLEKQLNELQLEVDRWQEVKVSVEKDRREVARMRNSTEFWASSAKWSAGDARNWATEVRKFVIGDATESGQEVVFQNSTTATTTTSSGSSNSPVCQNSNDRKHPGAPRYH